MAAKVDPGRHKHACLCTRSCKGTSAVLLMSTGTSAAGDNEVRPLGSIYQRLANADLFTRDVFEKPSRISRLCRGRISNASAGWTGFLGQLDLDSSCRKEREKML